MSTKICFTKELFFWSLLLWVGGCVDPFAPDVINAPEKYLVVDGFINSQGISTIKLSRTLNLTDAEMPPAESQATIYIEAKTGTRYSLIEQAAGTYISSSLDLDPAQQYRLAIKTQAGKEYITDYIAVKITPPIDAITWKTTANGLQIYINTHDPANNTQYYRWDYEDTWEFTSAYNTSLEFRDKRVQIRYEDIYRCWASEKSTAIKLGSTAKLSQDVVADYPLILLPVNSIKLRYKYSILVKQYAQTQEEYTYWETLRKNTENIGTIFDPLPTQLTGNIHCLSDPAEPVIGYVGAYSVTEKRIFISREELPEKWWRFNSGYEGCYPPDTVEVQDAPEYFEGNYNLPVSEVYAGPSLVGYIYSSSKCVDCRERGTNIKPDFWE